MMRSLCVAGMVVVAGACAARAQVVTFSDPSEWMTMREQSLVAKVQLDTAQIKSKKVSLAMYKVVNGRRRALGKARAFGVDDFSEEFALGSAGTGLLGGFDYLGIDWSIPGGKDKGTCEPFGLVVIKKWPEGEMVSVRKVADGLAAKDVVAGVKDSEYRKVGAGTYAMVWNKDALWVVCTGGAVEVAFDGKNAKNAFLSYPDRLVRLIPAKDSVYAYHCTRSFKDGKIAYPETVWHHETAVYAAGGVVAAGVRWHDTGIIPQNERAVGFAAFAVGEDGAVSASAPKGALRENPGTWGDIQLVE